MAGGVTFGVVVAGGGAVVVTIGVVVLALKGDYQLLLYAVY